MVSFLEQRAILHPAVMFFTQVYASRFFIATCLCCDARRGHRRERGLSKPILCTLVLVNQVINPGNQPYKQCTNCTKPDFKIKVQTNFKLGLYKFILSYVRMYRSYLVYDMILGRTRLLKKIGMKDMMVYEGYKYCL